MPNTASHHPHSRRTYSGEAEGRYITWFLNRTGVENDDPESLMHFGIKYGVHPGTVARHNAKSRVKLERGKQRVISLIEMLKTLIFGKPLYHFGNDRRLRDVRRINSLLPRYKSYSLLGPRNAPSKASSTPTEPLTLDFFQVIDSGRGTTTTECVSARAVLELAELNALDKLRVCGHCGLWFYARFAHQLFCKKDCQVKHNASSEQWKEYKRKKAREYYRLHKSGKVRDANTTRRAG